MPAGKSAAARIKAAIDSALSPKFASSGSLSEITEVIPTGLEVLDHHVLGCGGLPAGRVGEVFSDEGAGKSSLGFQLLGAGQRAGGVAVLVTTEDDLIVERAALFGCDLRELLLIEPQSLEEVLEGLKNIFLSIPKRSGPNVVVWDSLAATELKGQADKDLGGAGFVGRRGFLMSQALPILCRLARERRTAVVVINQVRSKIGVIFGDSDTTPGGNALKFHSSWRLQLWRGRAYRIGVRSVGIYTTIKAVKSKIGIPFNKAKLRLNFEEGWDNDWSVVEHGKEQKVISPSARVSKGNLQKVRESLGWIKRGDSREEEGIDGG